jgi:hypothetical protein
MSGIIATDGGLLAHAGEVDAGLISDTGKLAIEHNPAETQIAAYKSAKELQQHGQEIQQQGQLIKSEIQKNQWDVQLSGKQFEHQIVQDKLDIDLRQQMASISAGQLQEQIQEHKDTYGVALAQQALAQKTQAQSYSLGVSGQDLQAQDLKLRRDQEAFNENRQYAELGISMATYTEKMKLDNLDMQQKINDINTQAKNGNLPLPTIQAKQANEQTLLKNYSSDASDAGQMLQRVDNLSKQFAQFGGTGAILGRLKEYTSPSQYNLAQTIKGNSEQIQRYLNSDFTFKVTESSQNVFNTAASDVTSNPDDVQNMLSAAKAKGVYQQQHSTFAQQWFQSHGTLDGADDAFSKYMAKGLGKSTASNVYVPTSQDLQQYMRLTTIPDSTLQIAAKQNGMSLSEYKNNLGL